MQTIATENRLSRLVRRVESLPLSPVIQRRALTWFAGLAIPYLATSSIELELVRPERAVLSLRNRRKVQNHMKTVHASAMFLLAEAATGTVLTANLPDGSRFATIHIEIDYVRKAVGDLRATATLSPEQRALIASEAKGRLVVPVALTDAEGNEPARFSIEWSFKRREHG